MNDTIFQEGALVTSSIGRLYFAHGRRTWMEAPQKGKLCFYFPDFFLMNKKPWFTHENCEEFTLFKFFKKLPEVKPPEFHPNFNLSLRDKVCFFKTLEGLQKDFANNILKKAVPYLMASAEGFTRKKDILFLLGALLRYGMRHPLTYLYGFWEKGRGMLGATPELLFRLSDREMCTFALAGTLATQLRYRLLNDHKQLLEHQLVIQDICEKLRPFGTAKSQNTSVLVLPNLCHLKTPITVKLNQTFNPETMIQALHPTAALGAFPRSEGMKWLKTYQLKIDRMRFGAPVGFFDPEGIANFYVGIRNIQWEKSRAYMGVGCGIIPQSDPLSEWQEIQLKLKAIKRVFSL